MAAAAIIAVASFALAMPAASKEPPPASEEDITKALSAFQDWTAAFVAGDYRAQWLLTDKRIRRDSFTSVAELELAIDLYVAHHNIDPKPFIWTARASDILAKVTRAKAALATAAG